MERSQLEMVLGCCADTVLDEELCDIEMTVFGCHMEWSPPINVLGCGVSTVFNKEPCDIEMSIQGC
jgi:hypothetical protein